VKIPDVPKVIPLAADPLRIGRHSQSPCGEEVEQVLRLASERPILGKDGVLAGQEEGTGLAKRILPTIYSGCGKSCGVLRRTQCCQEGARLRPQTEPDAGVPWYSLDYRFVMEPGVACLPRPPIK